MPVGHGKRPGKMSNQNMACCPSVFDDVAPLEEHLTSQIFNTIKDSLQFTRQSIPKNIPDRSYKQCLKLPPIVVPKTNKSEEKWEVKGLPSDWIPNRKPSKIIQQLMKKKQAEHEAIVQAMKDKTAKLNSNIEDEIRIFAEVYKDNLAICLREMNDALRKLQLLCAKQEVLTNEDFTKTRNEIDVYYKAADNKLFVMIRKFKQLEQNRSEQYKTILKVANTKLHEICFKTPFEIQEFFSRELENINQITLNNYRNYCELKYQLRLNLEEERRIRFQKIQLIKHNWITYVKLSVFTRLNEDSLFGASEKIAKSATASGHCKMDHNVLNLIKNTKLPSLDLDQLHRWFQKVEAVINEIDACARDIVSYFKQAVISMFKSYFGEMKEIANTVLHLGVTADSPDVEIIKAEVCCPAIMTMGRKFQTMLRELQTFWDCISFDVHKHLKATFEFLKQFAELWEAHMLRIGQSKGLILKDLKKCMDENYLDIATIETDINILVDILRQESSKENLDTITANISKNLDKLIQVYNTNCDKECKTISKIIDLMKIESDLHCTELKAFLEEFRDSVFSEVRDGDDVYDDVAILKTEITFCQRQKDNLKLWKQQLYSIIEDYVDQCIEDNMANAYEWVNKEHAKLELKRKISIEVIHVVRYGRIKPVLYDLRLAELHQHEDRLEKHKAGIDKIITDLETLYTQFEAKFEQPLNEFENRTKDIEVILSKSKHATGVHGEIAVFDSLCESLVKNMQDFDEEYKWECSKQKERILCSNLHYVTSIKLFEDGGNFSPDEVKIICTEITKLEKGVEKKFATFNKQSSSKLSKSLQKVGSIQHNTHNILSLYKSELEYMDFYSYGLRDVHTDVKREVYLLKCNKKATFAHIRQIQDMYGSFLEDPEDLEGFSENLGIITRFMEKLRNALVRSTPDITSSFGDLKKLQELMSSKDLDHANLLFQFVPADDQTFLSKCRCIIYNSYVQLQRSAKTFYDANKFANFVTKDKIFPNYEAFIADVLPKYIYFYIQCELVWMEETHDFIRKVDELISYVNFFHKNTVNRYSNSAVCELTNLTNKVTEMSKNISLVGKDEYRKIRDKLKALHGYPGNRYMLDQLCQEMDTFLDKMKRRYSAPLNSVTTDLDEKQENTKAWVEHLDKELSSVAEVYSACPLRQSVIDDYKRAQSFLNNFVSADAIAATDKYQELASASAKLETYKKDIKIPPEYLLTTSFTSDQCSANNQSVSMAMYSIESETDLAASLAWCEAEKIFILRKVEEIIAANTDIVEVWKSDWNNEIQQVLNLYTVKYDTPEQN